MKDSRRSRSKWLTDYRYVLGGILENQKLHSKAKLALAVITSPGAAFEEILTRRLLGTGLVIALIAGAVSTIPAIISVAGGDRVQALMLGKSNPVVWLGLCMLIALAMQRLLKWIGAEVDYVGLLTLMGWSQITLIIVQLTMAALLWTQLSDRPMTTFISLMFAISATASLGYVYLMGVAVHTLSGSPKARGIMAYVVVLMATAIAFSQTYVTAKISPFADALPGISSTARIISGADQTPWTFAAAIGLTLGVLFIGRGLKWEQRQIRTNVVIAALVGLIAIVGYSGFAQKHNYYGKLRQAHESYIHENYSAAASQLERLLPVVKENQALILDTADVYVLAKRDDKALALYGRAADQIKHGDAPDKKQWLARASLGEGIALDGMGRYPEALAKFELAKKQWPEFREPWVRSALSFDRMGKYDDAITAGNQAVQTLGSKSTLAWVALADAFANKNDRVQAGTAITMVESADKKLASRIGSKLEDWQTAVAKLSREDLKFPSERELAPEPEKPEKNKAKKK